VGIPWASVGISGAGAGVSEIGVGFSGAEGRVYVASAEAVLLRIQCRFMTGEVNCSAVGRWCNASERWLGCDLGDAVRAASCGIHAALWVTCEHGLYVGD
jgi:hypothetical protein